MSTYSVQASDDAPGFVARSKGSRRALPRHVSLRKLRKLIEVLTSGVCFRHAMFLRVHYIRRPCKNATLSSVTLCYSQIHTRDASPRYCSTDVEIRYAALPSVSRMRIQRMIGTPDPRNARFPTRLARMHRKARGPYSILEIVQKLSF